MHTIEINEDALPILRSGISLQKRLHRIKTKNYSERLKKFEEKYNMNSGIFIREFEAGNMGDDAALFDWFFVWNVWKKAVERNKLFESLSL